MMNFVGKREVGPFLNHCVKCHQGPNPGCCPPAVVFREGPHTFRYNDYLDWLCYRCGYTWYTETADYKPPVVPDTVLKDRRA